MSYHKIDARSVSNRPRFLYPLLVMGVLGVSFSAVLIRLSNAPPLVIATYRMFFTTLILLPTCIAQKNKFSTFRPTTFALSVLSGLLLAFHFAFWISSLGFTSVASSTVIVTTQPVFVLIGSYFIFGERFTIRLFIFMVSAFLGSSLIGFGDFSSGAQVLKGDILALGGAVFIAGYMLIGRIVRQTVDLIPYTLVVYLSAASALLIASTLMNIKIYPYPYREYILFASLAVFSTIIGHTIFNWAIKYVSAVTVSTSILGEPIGATILAVIILKEFPTGWQIFGGIIVIFSLLLFMKEQNRIEKHLK